MSPDVEHHNTFLACQTYHLMRLTKTVLDIHYKSQPFWEDSPLLMLLSSQPLTNLSYVKDTAKFNSRPFSPSKMWIAPSVGIRLRYITDPL